MKIASDKYRFDCVWKATWYRLGSLSDHHHKKVDPTGPVLLLMDSMSRYHLAPREEVHIPYNPIPH